MVGNMRDSETQFSPTVGFIYVFNLMVGTGALTLPGAFANAGWLISLIVIVLLALISFITLTFVVETMGAANAILRRKKFQQAHKKDVDIKDQGLSNEAASHDDYSDISSPSSPTRSWPDSNDTNPGDSVIHSTADLVENSTFEVPDENCNITETVEMAKMSEMFFSKIGNILFFACIAIYLYGDLAIYGAAVGKSLRDVACTYFPPDIDCNSTLNGTERCWDGVDISRDDAYRIFLSIFTVTIGSFGFFNVSKTKLLQIVTTLVRWAAFLLMIVLACIRLADFSFEELGHPSVANFAGIPTLFGACIYSFMCHHSLPSLVTPITPKRHIYRLFTSDYILVGGFYLLLAFTGIFAFPVLNDLYTLNFIPDRCSSVNDQLEFLSTSESGSDIAKEVFGYFLSLFPVFTLSTSFPIITITLRNNLKALFLSKNEAEYSFFTRRLLFPLLALIPPTIIALITSDIGFLVGITGSYAGAGVQYVVPALLVFYARKALVQEFGSNSIRNSFASPFKHVAFIFIVLIWAFACIGFVTYNHIVTGK